MRMSLGAYAVDPATLGPGQIPLLYYIDPATTPGYVTCESVNRCGMYDASNPMYAQFCTMNPEYCHGTVPPPVPGTPGYYEYAPAGYVPAYTVGTLMPNSLDIPPPPSPTSALVPPSVSDTPTPTLQQIAGGQTVAGNTGMQITNVGGSAGFTMPAILTEASVGGVPNWMLIAGAVVALMMFKK